MSKHVGEKCGKLIDGETGWTDGSRPGHHHTIIRPVWRRAYKTVLLHSIRKVVIYIIEIIPLISIKQIFDINNSKWKYLIFYLFSYIIRTDSIVLWKIQNFDWLISETKWHSCLHNRALCSYLATLRLLRQREKIRSFRGHTSIAMSVIKMRRVTIHIKALRFATRFYVSWRVSSLTFIFT